MRIVFDIDDTICDNNGRDYINAIPNKEIIKKINYLHDKEKFEIILYTSRGMKSCNGNITKIKKKNEKILIEWLKKNKVHYDELIFGKPLGDMYVDDKAVEVREFMKLSFEKLNGGSNNKTYSLGKYIKKDLCSNEKLINFKEWIKESEGMCNTPHVISYLYNEVYLDYIEKTSSPFSIPHLKKIMSIVFSFKNKKYNSFDINILIEQLKKNDLDNKIHKKIEFCISKIKEIEQILIKEASFSHGDCSLSNIILAKDGFYFIDENYYKEASSYLLDLAKLRCSLDNYEYIFNISNSKLDKKFKETLDKKLIEKHILDVIVILEYMWFIRMYRYKNNKDKNKIIKILNNIEKENKWKIK